MACFHPVAAFRSSDGVRVLQRGDVLANFSLACGRCVGCRVERARQWSVRIMHEASLYDSNCFLTLTYDEAHRPKDGSLVYRDFQLFMKRLRKCFSFKDDFGNVWTLPIRYFMCGEYGEDNSRPHFHAALFNVAFLADRYQWSVRGGFPVYRSPTLERLWRFGLSEFGELTSDSAAYIARYVMKKVNGGLAESHYRRIDESTGEVVWVEPEFAHMSNRPGIGARWFERFSSDVYPHDRVIYRGRKSKPPRYYDALMERLDRQLVKELKAAREAQARLRWPDNTPGRLRTREEVAKARLSFSRRKLK